MQENRKIVDDNQNDANGQNDLYQDEMKAMIDEMVTISKVISKQLEVAYKKIPLLTMFEKYKLPLQTKEEVVLLEAQLQNSHDFLKFFVSSVTSNRFQNIAHYTSLIYYFIGLSRCAYCAKSLSKSKVHIGRVHLLFNVEKCSNAIQMVRPNGERCF